LFKTKEIAIVNKIKIRQNRAEAKSKELANGGNKEELNTKEPRIKFFKSDKNEMSHIFMTRG